MSDRPREIFSRIARRYDLLNRVLSFGREQEWRRRGVVYLPEGRVLDLGSGTGAAQPVFGGREVVALDPVPEMLELNPIGTRVVAYGEGLPFADESFDGVFSAYVFRNLSSIPATLREVARVLRPGGVLVVVGLGRPRNRYARLLHRIGSAVFLPLAGLMIGSPGEYWYLHRSLDKLAPPEELFASGPLTLERVWRMGPLGFVYGAVMRKP
ncbi:MAG TPA: class I SAM-dependent methyltransferase [Acidimicrobiia bacterium]|nr:class I SAM-dependent methyltransferase [Acidimicrobiia bacterium]